MILDQKPRRFGKDHSGMEGATFQKEEQANANHGARASMDWLRKDKEAYVSGAK